MLNTISSPGNRRIEKKRTGVGVALGAGVGSAVGTALGAGVGTSELSASDFTQVCKV